MKKIFLVSLLFIFFPAISHAAILRLSPETGVYVSGTTFTVSVLMNTEGKPVNAADAVLSFNPKELSVVSIRKGSLFSLWTLEPSFSNTAGTISFGGGSPAGYTGTNGVIASITFKAHSAGTPKVSYTSASVLAADGLGTNVLTSMKGASFTVEAASSNPLPEYVPPPNTPPQPTITSSSHPDENMWYARNQGIFSWSIPTGVVQVRTAFDQSEATTPTKVYETPITERTVDDMPEGTSYFHVQFKNADGWGRVRHFKVNVDTKEPESFELRDVTATSSSPLRSLIFDVKDTSPIQKIEIVIDGDSPIVYTPESLEVAYVTHALTPGEHTIVATLYDSAGHTRVTTLTTTIDALPRPKLTDYPLRVNESVIPAFKGETLPGHIVVATIVPSSGILDSAYASEQTIEVRSDDSGSFTIVPESSFAVGSYTITLYAKGDDGARSNTTDPVSFIVEAPGYIVIGSLAIRVLSVLIPLIALVLLLLFGSWYMWHKLSVWRKRVMYEAQDAEEKLAAEFNFLADVIHGHIEKIRTTRKTRITKAEEDMYNELETDLKRAQSKLRKEIIDIETAAK